MGPELIDLSNAEIAGENLYVVRRTAADTFESSALVITGVPFDLSTLPDNSFDAILTVPKERVHVVKGIENRGFLVAKWS